MIMYIPVLVDVMMEKPKKIETNKILISETINKYLTLYSKVKDKIMYGTDLFAVSDEYNDVTSYIELVD